MSDMDFVTRSGFDLLESKIEELRKDINYNDQQVNNRINVMNAYLSREIAKVVKVVLDNATRDAFYNKLVEENKQLKEEIEHLKEDIGFLMIKIKGLNNDRD